MLPPPYRILSSAHLLVRAQGQRGKETSRILRFPSAVNILKGAINFFFITFSFINRGFGCGKENFYSCKKPTRWQVVGILVKQQVLIAGLGFI